MLVIRTSDGEIRWMDVSAYLKRESVGGKTVRPIVFAGERNQSFPDPSYGQPHLGLVFLPSDGRRAACRIGGRRC